MHSLIPLPELPHLVCRFVHRAIVYIEDLQGNLMLVKKRLVLNELLKKTSHVLLFVIAGDNNT